MSSKKNIAIKTASVFGVVGIALATGCLADGDDPKKGNENVLPDPGGDYDHGGGPNGEPDCYPDDSDPHCQLGQIESYDGSSFLGYNIMPVKSSGGSSGGGPIVLQGQQAPISNHTATTAAAGRCEIDGTGGQTTKTERWTYRPNFLRFKNLLGFEVATVGILNPSMTFTCTTVPNNECVQSVAHNCPSPRATPSAWGWRAEGKSAHTDSGQNAGGVSTLTGYCGLAAAVGTDAQMTIGAQVGPAGVGFTFNFAKWTWEDESSATSVCRFVAAPAPVPKPVDKKLE